ncbi:transcriptional regulator, AraC family protein [Flavobacteriales bacterium ALC-1]|nr:transcriptional regulator, AraC family protein [Flavobacteriales bacterium ALC-1]
MEILQKGEYTGDIIKRLAIDDSIVTHTHYSAKKNNTNWHYHENLHICFVFQGGKADTKKETTYTQKDGSIFFYHSGEQHRWISPNAISKSANIEIGPNFLNTYHLNENSIKQAIYKNVDSKALILKIQNEMLDANTQNSAAIHSLLLQLITKGIDISEVGIPKWVTILNQLLHDNWNESMSLNQMSQIIGVHPITISKYFRKYFNCTLGEYQRKLKIEKSIELIKNSLMSLTEIAFFCGFTDQSHFIRNFKSMTGFLPKEFQKF